MKIYLDSDVHPEVQLLLGHLGNVKRAVQRGWQDELDSVAYELAVRDDFDLVVTCNKSDNKQRLKGGFAETVLKDLKCSRDALPIPICELWKKGIGNNWVELKKYWPEFLGDIEHIAQNLGEKHEQRRAQAIEKFEQLVKGAEVKRVEQELNNKPKL